MAPPETSIRRLTALLVCLSVLLGSPRATLANGNPVRLGDGGGTVGRIEPRTDTEISLDRETLRLDLLPTYLLGKVTYELRNHGGPVTITFGFPAMNPGQARNPLMEDKVLHDPGRLFVHYVIRVDGALQPVKVHTERQHKSLSEFLRLTGVSMGMVTTRSRPGVGQLLKKVGAMSEMPTVKDDFKGQVTYDYRLTPIAFAAGQVRMVEIEFAVRNLMELWAHLDNIPSAPKRLANFIEGYTYACYLMQPARSWKGRIREADLQVVVHNQPLVRDRPAPVAFDPPPQERSGNTYRWRYRDWEPDVDLRMLYYFYDRWLMHLPKDRYADSWEFSVAGMSRNALSPIQAEIVDATSVDKVEALDVASRPGQPRVWVDARDALDGDPANTAWISRPVKVKGEYPELRVTLKAPVRLQGFGLVPHEDGQNRGTGFPHARPRTVQVQVDDGVPMEVSLEDRFTSPFVLPVNLQRFSFAEPMSARQITFRIRDVYPGRGPSPGVELAEIVLFKAPAPPPPPVATRVDAGVARRPGSASDAGRRVASAASRTRPGGRSGCGCTGAPAGPGLLSWLLVGLLGWRLRTRR